LSSYLLVVENGNCETEGAKRELVLALTENVFKFKQVSFCGIYVCVLAAQRDCASGTVFELVNLVDENSHCVSP